MATHDPAHRPAPKPAVPRDTPESDSATIDVLFRDEAEFETARPRHARAIPPRERMLGIELIPILPSDAADAAAFPDELDFIDGRGTEPVAQTPQQLESYAAVPRAGVGERSPAVPRALAPRKRSSPLRITAIGIAALLVLGVAAGVSMLRRAPSVPAATSASAPPPVNRPDVLLPPAVRAESLGTTGATATPDHPVGPLPEPTEPATSTAPQPAPPAQEQTTRPAMEPRAYATAPAPEEPAAPAPPVVVPESPRPTPLAALPESTVASSPVAPPPPVAPAPVERAASAAPAGVERTTTPAPQPVVNEAAAIRVALSRFAAGYSDLDPAAVSAVWPSVDRAGLSRAFSTLDAQQVTFDKCDIQVSGSVGNATCVGTAMWLPKIGGQTRELARTWKFVLKNAAGAWQIVTSESR